MTLLQSVEKRPPAGRLLVTALVIALDLLSAAGYGVFALRNGAGHFTWDELSYALIPCFAAIIIYKQPWNRVGWAMAAFGLLNIGNNALGEYGYYALITRPGSLPFGALVTWVAATWWLLGQPVAVAVILLFPNGRPPTPRWWLVIALVYAVSVPIFAFIGFHLWEIRGPRLLVADLPTVLGPTVWRQYALLGFGIWEPTFVGCMALAVIGQAVRFARSRGVERLQLKWTLLAFSVVPFNIALDMLTPLKNNPLTAALSEILNILSVVGFPIAMSFAITRYHLYDIDLIIRRTLLYGALSVALGGLYFCSVVLLQSVLARVDGGSPVSIVLSTLLIAALFSPLRARFQRVIDRRFYRTRYNSEQILERFTASLRSEVDLDAIHRHLLATVDGSLQPGSAALWLVKGESTGRGLSRVE